MLLLLQQFYYIMSKSRFITLLYLCLTVQLGVSQEYVRLNKDIYQLHLSEYPKDTIRVLEKGKETKLKPGKYILQKNQFMGLSNAFISINQEGIVESDFKIEKDGKQGFVVVRHGILQQINVKSATLPDFQYTITDTSSVQRNFKNGKISQEKTVFYQAANNGKKITKVFFDNYYSVENDFDHTRADYRLDNTLMYSAKLNCGGQIQESKSFDAHGQLLKHTYRKAKVDYTDLYQNNNLIERKYNLENCFYHEYFKNSLLVQKVVEKKDKGNTEKYVYNGAGKLMDKNTGG
ncbi:hypothetical protein QE382_003534 [Sphingobacterium zeae]|uniref:YD repeat-containing protein n=2 Tax=Sphingobacterium zeae TaxID=1776859 RepID=A0ABU0U9L4_9SPHI|nr:hypothetical protein [Sphingobacterium zeae]